MAQPLTRPQENEDLISWLQLTRCENVGPITFHQLIERYGTPEEALKALPELATQGGLKRSLRLISRAEIEKELTSLDKFGAQFITFNSPLYPPLLRHIDSAPPLLAVKGKLSLLQEPAFAIVGARNASALGKKTAHSFAEKLGKEGWVIVSGLARGIDGAAHLGSLKT
ncbi:MAG: DNA-protecting protein DprA, partial [Alphaproteobacteria bacterium]|nr:DNA-protecting protein DprA [Alphaproteobacteria bacterium]